MFTSTLRICERRLPKKDLFDSRFVQSVTACYYSSKSGNAVDFKPIYKYPFISIGATINKIKKLQIAATGLAVPGSLIANSLSVCDLNTTVAISGVCLASTTAICLVGQVFSHMIGFVYTSPDLQTVRFSYLDFWGGRQNIDFPREELVPLTDSAKYPSDFMYRKVYRYSGVKPHKINLRSGEILNTEAFKYIFKHCPD